MGNRCYKYMVIIVNEMFFEIPDLDRNGLEMYPLIIK